ncbi:tripartite tricarboxylate transporter substrate binding protein [Ramlibacter sp. G-1-2-2]|uniref:Tripartite tricarboxylate transporter substrate binding protein n=1 Tax=Ramlibacter agri TaxID=2728837 RepID=A0A848HCF1_9BURK|nr:tripartite tricarboxylate transporter substrate binding protein [Ramlibacter agri]NML48415.1 tripartite tricarboxylate transporter substrate binding protein [Ramlibacter agri]
MVHKNRRQAVRALAGAAALAVLPLARAQASWPRGPVKLVVPFPAGGSTDAFARLLARKLSDSLGQPFVVDNKPGANGNIGAGFVASAPADGNTLMLSTTGPLSVNKLLYKSTPFDPQKDFTPIALLADVPLLVACHPSLPVKDLKELIAYLKANPHQVSYSTGGNGSMGHLSAELLQRATGTSMIHVPYKGSAGALTDLVAGVVKLSFDLVPTYLEQINAGKVRAIAVLGPQRTPSLPGVPTLQESGYKAVAVGWYGLVGPKGLPPAVVASVNKVANEFLASTEGRAQLQTFGMGPIGGKPEALSAFVQSEMDKWRPIVEPLASTIMQ